MYKTHDSHLLSVRPNAELLLGDPARYICITKEGFFIFTNAVKSVSLV